MKPGLCPTEELLVKVLSFMRYPFMLVYIQNNQTSSFLKLPIYKYNTSTNMSLPWSTPVAPMPLPANHKPWGWGPATRFIQPSTLFWLCASLRSITKMNTQAVSSVKKAIKYGRVRVLKCGPPMNSPLKYISNITASYVFGYLNVLGYLINFIYIIFVRKGSVHFNLLILLHV